MKLGPFEGKSFYDEHSMSDALERALEYARPSGHVASLPELIQWKIEMEFEEESWTNWYTAYSEENVGQTAQGTPVVLTIHGGGILGTPKRIQQALEGGLIGGSAKYTQKEFFDALDGKMPDGSDIQIYPLNDFKRLQKTPRRYGVVMDLEHAQTFPSSVFNLENFLKNDIAEVRCGGKKAQKAYARKVLSRNSNIGCYHPFRNINAQKPRGRVLFLNCTNYSGLTGCCDMESNVHMVGVRAREPSRLRRMVQRFF